METWRLYGFGVNTWGQVGMEGASLVEPRIVPALQNIEIHAVAVGYEHTLALDSTGNVFSFGENMRGELGRATDGLRDMRTPTQVVIGRPVVGISAGEFHSAALTVDGDVFAWGAFKNRDFAVFGVDDFRIATERSRACLLPVKITPWVKVSEEVSRESLIERIVSGDNHVVMLGMDGQVFTCGAYDGGQLGRLNDTPMRDRHHFGHVIEESVFYTRPRVVDNLEGLTIVNIWAGAESSFFHSSEGEIFACGRNNLCQLGIQNRLPVVDRVIRTPQLTRFRNYGWTQIVAGRTHTTAITLSGDVFETGQVTEGDTFQAKRIKRLKCRHVEVLSLTDRTYGMKLEGELCWWTHPWELRRPRIRRCKPVSTPGKVQVTFGAGKGHIMLILADHIAEPLGQEVREANKNNTPGRSRSEDVLRKSSPPTVSKPAVRRSRSCHGTLPLGVCYTRNLKLDPKPKCEAVAEEVVTSPAEISLQMETGSGEGHHVKLEEGAAAVSGSRGPAKTGNLEGKEDAAVLELEGAIKKLHLKGDLQRKVMKGGLLSKLEKARVETADRGKVVRRMKWRDEVKMEVLKREEIQRTPGTVSLEALKDWRKAEADMSKMSLEWMEAFEHERANFLIYEVLPIIFEDSFAPDSKGEVVLTCRPVSRHWKNAAEACVLFHIQPGVQGLRLLDIPICAPHFVSWPMIARFNHWSEQGYSGTNPFFSRKVVFAGGAFEWKNNLEFWRGGETLLRRWGSEVWNFMVRFDKGMTFEVMYEQLVKYLKLMPNLRCLVILDTPGSASNSRTTNMMRQLGKDVYGPLRARIARNPLPELPQLKQLQLQDCVIPPLALAMFAKYGGLEDVLMRGSESGEDPHPMESLTGRGHPLPQLKFLTISSFAYLRAFDLSMNCPSLERFLLKELYVEGAADVLVVFQNLNRLKPISTLKRLSLVIQPTIWGPMVKLSDEQLKRLRLDLPQLDFFSLNAMHINLKNIDFLLPCSGLKELELIYQKVKVKNMPEEDKQSASGPGSGGKGKKNNEKEAATGTPVPPLEETIKFFEYTNRLYESNLWMIFPELTFVRICVTASVLNGDEKQAGYMPGSQIVKRKIKVYTREGFKKSLGCGGLGGK